MGIETLLVLLIVIFIIMWAFSPRLSTVVSVEPLTLRTIFIIFIAVIILIWLYKGGVFGSGIYL